MKRACLAVLLLAAGPALAAPTDPGANQHLQAGLAHFGKKAYDQAIDEFKAGWAIEQDTDILYAWAQAERMRGNCPGAMKLYKQYLAISTLTPAQQKAGQVNLERCQRALAGEDLGREPDKQPDRTPDKQAVPPAADPHLVEQPPPPLETTSPWYTDALGDVLLGAGIAGLAVGTVEYLSSSSEEDAANSSTTYQDYKDHIDSAQSKRTIAFVAAGAGTALVIGGIVRYATRGHHRADASAWLMPGGGGVLVFGRF